MNNSPTAPNKPASAENKSDSLKALVSQIVRYAFVGGASAAFELVVFQVLYAIAGIGLDPSKIIQLVAYHAVHFTMNRSLAFKS